MIDQAQALRVMAEMHNKKKTKIMTVTSGKGGVGKSSFALNLAIAFVRMGKRALIIDTDFGFSNIDVMLGIKTKYDLMDAVNNNVDIRDIIETGHGGVKFISGGSGVYELVKMREDQLLGIVNNILKLEDIADIIIFDTGAGVSDNILRLINASHETILITTPEPTAVVDVYAMIKIINEEIGKPGMSLVVNKAGSPKEAQIVMNSFEKIVKKNLDIDINKLGYIVRDVNMQKAIKMQTPILISFPKCAASVNIDMLARNYLDMPVRTATKPGLAGFLEKFTNRKSFASE